MDPRNYSRYLRADWDRRREEAWLEMHRRPDAEPLPDEPERPWSERVFALRWLFAAARVARRVSPGTLHVRRPTIGPAHVDRPRRPGEVPRPG